jgi:hypothetical protein
LELRTKALYFVQPRGEIFGIVNKGIVFGSAAQRKFWKYNKLTVFIQPYGIANKSTAFCSAAYRKSSELRTKGFFFFSPERKFWNRDQSSILFSCAAKLFGIANKNVLELRPKALHFVQPRTKIF